VIGGNSLTQQKKKRRDLPDRARLGETDQNVAPPGADQKTGQNSQLEKRGRKKKGSTSGRGGFLLLLVCGLGQGSQKFLNRGGGGEVVSGG